LPEPGVGEISKIFEVDLSIKVEIGDVVVEFP